MRNRRSTVINLFGGLGNQLFQYSCGKYLEQLHSHNVVFNTALIGNGVTNHRVSLEGRSLPDTFAPIESKTPALSWLTRRIPFSSQQEFRSRETGWNPLVEDVRRGSIVNGYFQSYRYFSALLPYTLTRNHLHQKGGISPWLRTMIREAEIDEPIVVHVRRGDYRKVEGYMGLVGYNYFLEASKRLLQEGINRPLWIFSDEANEAIYVAELLGNRAEAKIPPEGTDPGESLILMTYGRAHILSNSTFGWWASKLSPTSKATVVPEPWLRGEPTPRDLFPSEWIRIRHSWGKLTR